MSAISLPGNVQRCPEKKKQKKKLRNYNFELPLVNVASSKNSSCETLLFRYRIRDEPIVLVNIL